MYQGKVASLLKHIIQDTAATPFQTLSSTPQQFFPTLFPAHVTLGGWLLYLEVKEVWTSHKLEVITCQE